MEIREMRAELDSIPDETLLAIGLPQIHFYNIGGSFKALCPFHDDKHLGSFGYNPFSHTWKCFACDHSGKGVYSLMMDVYGWTFVETIKHLYAHRYDVVAAFDTQVPPSLMQKGKSSGKSAMKGVYTPKQTQPMEIPEVSLEEDFLGHGPLSPADIDHIYGAFAASSPLTMAEKEALRVKRGITMTSCADFFRFPSNWDKEFWLRFRTALSKYDTRKGEERLYHSLIGVPGFFWDAVENRPGFVYAKKGLGILNRGVDGLITGVEIRLRDSAIGSRYIGFSSLTICQRYPERCKHGAKAGIIDVVSKAYANMDDQGIAVTEGKFKAIHLSYRGYTAVSIRGITNWRKSLPVLKRLVAGDKKVTIAFDADMKKNPAVASAASEFCTALLEEGFDVQFLSWPLCYGKGFDDLCNNGCYHKVRTTPGQKYLETTLSPFLAKAKKSQVSA